MITWADVLPLKSGNIVIRIPARIEQSGKLTVVVRDGSYDIYLEKTRIAKIGSVMPEVLDAFAASELLGILEWPENERPPSHLERYARVVDKRKPA